MHVRASGRLLTPRRALLLLLLCLLAAGGLAALGLGGSGQRPDEARAAESDSAGNVVFAIHGGAGSISRDIVPPELEQQYRAALRVALEAGYGVIQRGGQATDAVKAAIVMMEDSELFNAGNGSFFTTDAGHELDASLMDGETLDTGAVTGVEHIRNPIMLADMVRTASIPTAAGRPCSRRRPASRSSTSASARSGRWPSTGSATWRRAPPPAV